MKTKKKSVFEMLCERVAGDIGGVSVHFHHDEKYQKPFEDDGTLHVVSRGIRACFDVSNCQQDSGIDQNRKTIRVLEMLAMKKSINARVLVEELDDENHENDEIRQHCPHCGSDLD